MRRALGLQGSPPAQPGQPRSESARPRHRFVQDGEVPVVVLNSPRAPDAAPSGRAAALQAALDGERAARAGAERALAEAQTTIQSLRTQLAHAGLAHGEALAAERRMRERVEAALQEAVAARETAEQRLNEVPTRPTEPAAEPPAPRVRAKRAASATAPKPAAAKGREAQPVKWWLPSYKAKAKGR